MKLSLMKNDPAHAAWGPKISNTVKVIEDKLVTFLLEVKAKAVKVDEQEEPAAKKQRKNYNKIWNANLTINKVKEIIDLTQLTKSKVF
jgi:hypothetical protein